MIPSDEIMDSHQCRDKRAIAANILSEAERSHKYEIKQILPYLILSVNPCSSTITLTTKPSRDIVKTFQD